MYKKSLERIEIIKKQYKIEGAMTIRRIYYIFLGKELGVTYHRLCGIVKEARLKGLIDWEMINDGMRHIYKRATRCNFQEAFEDCCENYRKNSMELQKKNIEIWSEKDTVINTLYQISCDLDIPLVDSKGFSSITFRKELADRVNASKKPFIILYISDYDPEGNHFPNLVRETLYKFDCKNFKIEKLILTKKQIDDNDLRWIKIKWKNIKKQLEKQYVRDYLKENNMTPDNVKKVELDALPNNIMQEILKKRLNKLIDEELAKQSDKESLEEVKNWKKENLIP